LKSYKKAYSTYFLISLYRVGWIWNGLLDFSIFLIHMSRESSFSSIRSSKLSEVLKIPLIDPMRNEKKVSPMNSRAMEKMYSSDVEPE
jgi:hypothetical protein